MSFYIGDQDDGSKCLHMYKNSSNMEKEPIDGTIFHSRLPYMRIKSRHIFQAGTLSYPSPSVPSRQYNLMTDWCSAIPLETVSEPTPFIVMQYFFYNDPSSPSGLDWIRFTMATTPVVFTAGNPPPNYYFVVGDEAVQQRPIAFLTTLTTMELYYTNNPQFLEVIFFEDLSTLYNIGSLRIDKTGILFNNKSLFTSNNYSGNDFRYLHYMGDNPNNRINDIYEVIAIPSGQTYTSTGGYPIQNTCYQTRQNRFSATSLTSGTNNTCSHTLFQVMNTCGYESADFTFLELAYFYTGTLFVNGIEIDTDTTSIKANIGNSLITLIDPNKKFLRLMYEVRNAVLTDSSTPLPPQWGGCTFVRSINVPMSSNSLLVMNTYNQFTTPRRGGMPSVKFIELTEGREEIVASFLDYVLIRVNLSAQRLDVYVCRPVGSINFITPAPYNCDILIFDKTY